MHNYFTPDDSYIHIFIRISMSLLHYLTISLIHICFHGASLLYKMQTCIHVLFCYSCLGFFYPLEIIKTLSSKLKAPRSSLGDGKIGRLIHRNFPTFIFSWYKIPSSLLGLEWLLLPIAVIIAPKDVTSCSLLVSWSS